MRTLALLVVLGSAIAACSFGQTSDPAADGYVKAPVCSTEIADCSHLNPNLAPPGNYCTLEDGSARLCASIVFIHQGSTYTYLDYPNVDVGSRFVYDASGNLVASLYLDPTGRWTCFEGRSDFELTESNSISIFTPDGRRPACPADGGRD